MNKLFFVFALISFVFFSAQASMLLPKNNNSKVFEIDGDPVNVFVHISAVKEGKNGKKTAKILKITLAKGQAGKNMVPAKLRREGNLLQFEIQMQKQSFDRLVMPKGFVINDRISKLLGSSKGVVMSGGSTMLKKSSNGLLQFEIQ